MSLAEVLLLVVLQKGKSLSRMLASYSDSETWCMPVTRSFYITFVSCLNAAGRTMLTCRGRRLRAFSGVCFMVMTPCSGSQVVGTLKKDLVS